MRYGMSASWKFGRAPRVCVVGAGFSGLVCAERLGKQGVDVNIVEARDRVGGRVHQVHTVGHWTDMGANWIHGAHVNPIRDIATEVGAVTLGLDDSTSLYDEDGKPIAEGQAEKLEEVTWSIIENAFRYSSSGADIPVTKSLYDFVAEQIESKDLSKQEKRTVLHMSEMWGGYIGTPVQRQSLKYLFLEASLEGENVFIVSTYRDILRHVESQALKYAAIYLGNEVTSISAESNSLSSGISIETKISEHRLQNMASLRPASTYDAIVVTIPFGCLKERQVAFSPDLPGDLVHAIDSITYGTLEKVYVRFPNPFWVTTENPSPFFTHFLHPTFTSENPDHWDIGLVSLASKPENASQSLQSTLLFYIYGPSGKHVTNLVAGLQPSDPAYMERLAKFFKPYYSRLPNYDEEREDCGPIAMLATDWQHDRLAGFGSYTNWQIDNNEKDGLPPKMPLDDAIKTLRHGLPERNIFFAGEHTSPFAALGTVTGAYLSGEAVAERVLQQFRDQGDVQSGAEHNGNVLPQIERSVVENGVQVGKAMSEQSATVQVGRAVE